MEEKTLPASFDFNATEIGQFWHWFCALSRDQNPPRAQNKCSKSKTILFTQETPKIFLFFSF
jgi:hypothetical protein